MAGPNDWPGTPVTPSPPAGGNTLAQRGAAVTGPWQQRAVAQGASRVGQRQEQTAATQQNTTNDQLQLLSGLGQARRLIDSGTPTGALADEAMWAGRAVPPAFRGNLGIPSTQDLEHLGTLEKLSGLAAQAIGGADQDTRAALRGALFGVDKDQATNRNNVNFLTQWYANQLISQRTQQAWLERYGDINAVDPATGMNASDYIAAVRQQLPTRAADYEDARNYRTAVRTRSGATIDLPELQPMIEALSGAIKGDGEFAPAPQRQPAPQQSPQPQAQQKFREGGVYVDAHGNRARFTHGQFTPVQ